MKLKRLSGLTSFALVLQMSVVLCLILSCGNTAPKQATPEMLENVADTTIDVRAKVKVQPVRKETFQIETISNGIIEARSKVEIKLQTDGRVIYMPFKSGDYVKAGDLICQQDTTALQLQLQEQLILKEEAWNQLGDMIMMQGGDVIDTNSVNTETLKTLKNKSGWDMVRHRIKTTKYLIDQASLVAPISGWVYDVQVNQFQDANKGETLFTIINPSSYELTFSLLESESTAIKTGQSVKFHSLGNPEQLYQAKVARFEPVIDEYGLLTVIANISGNKTHLKDGMKVRVILEQHLPGQLVVPKSSRVIRSNRDVIFTADVESSLAKWNYVTIGQENSQYFTIVDGLNEGDLVIYEGNLNLDHDAEIMIENE